MSRKVTLSEEQQIPSTSSGRSTPEVGRRRQPPEDGEKHKDKNYRKYAAGIGRALSLGDHTQQEWADYISFLGRLQKAVQAHQGIVVDELPYSSSIAKRLAQCLNPSLPSGVHQKALEVYNYIFSIIKKPGLARDLHIYLPTLSGVLSFASLSIRPYFLTLFEKYILRLDNSSIRPALKAIILSLLPGLEDESSEDFDRVLRVLSGFKYIFELKDNEETAEDESYFWQCFFLASITSPSRRQGALAFLTRKLPKFIGSEDRKRKSSNAGSSVRLTEATSIVKPEPGLLVRCFIAGLTDTQILTQRGFLDLLVSRLPLHSAVLQQQANPQDLAKLVICAVGVVTRRDMSLNRRLWTWFIGPEKDKESLDTNEENETRGNEKKSELGSTLQKSYFSQYGSSVLTRSLLEMIRKGSGTAAERARPFRILLSLMDRSEIGTEVIPRTFIPAVENVYAYSEATSFNNADEVVRSASMFFDGVESDLIWSLLLEYGLSALDSEGQNATSRLRRLKIIRFIITRFNVREEEMILAHIPIVSLAYFAKLSDYVEFSQRNNKYGSDDIIETTLEICIVLVSEVPSRGFTMYRRSSEAKKLEVQEKSTNKITWKAIQRMYTNERDLSNLSKFPGLSNGPGFVFLRRAVDMFRTTLKPQADPKLVELCGRLLQLLLRKTIESRPIDYTELLTALHEDLLRISSHYDDAVPFEYISAIMGNLTAVTSVVEIKENVLHDKSVSALIVLLTSLAWRYMDPLTPQHHMEAFRCLCQIHELTSSERLVESILASHLSITGNNDEPKFGKSIQSARRFAVLWSLTSQQQSTYAERPTKSQEKNRKIDQAVSYQLYPGALSRPLYLLLDCSFEEDMELYNFVQEWLYFMPSVKMLMDAVFKPLAFSSLSLHKESGYTSQSDRIRFESSPEHIIRETRYYLQHLMHILKEPPSGLWDYLLTNTVSYQVPDYDNNSTITVQNYILNICMGIISRPDFPETKFDALRINALKVIELLQATPNKESLEKANVDSKLINILSVNLNIYSPPVLMSFLDTARISLLPRIRSAYKSNPPAQSASQEALDQSPEAEAAEKAAVEAAKTTLIKSLIECYMKGLTSASSYFSLNHWTTFWFDCAPLWSQHIFQHIIPLVSMICRQIELVFDNLQKSFYRGKSNTIAPEDTLILYMTILQNIQGIAARRLVTDDFQRLAAKTHEPPQGFLGNVVSNAFSSETTPAVVTGQNNSLTLVLCYQDSLKICFRLWMWGTHFSKLTQNMKSSTQASFNHTSMRVRNKARQLIEDMFGNEAMEIVENLAYMWVHDGPSGDTAKSVLAFLQVVDGSKPKNIMPAIFNALYSRTNPKAIETVRLSTYTSKITETELAAFLMTYTETLEDDTIDEIWSDCTTFLLHVLANPLPQRQIIPVLLEFTVLLAEKLDNTNFGEQRKMRKELSDIFMRLLTATFTTKPMSQYQNRSLTSGSQDKLPSNISIQKRLDLLEVLCAVVPKLRFLFTEHDRLSTVLTNISNNLTITMIRSKSYPENMSGTSVKLMLYMLKAPALMKNWKRDVSEAFNDNRFIQFQYHTVRDHWLPLLNQWTTSDKDCISEIVSRIPAPSSAGIMFGVGAVSARLEADRKTQHALRRLALLVLSSSDKPIGSYGDIEARVNELLTATPTTSPSSVTRADTYMLLRALVMHNSGTQLATLWTIITSELQSAFVSLFSEDSRNDKYNATSLLQAAKLLDLLVVVSPEDFQLHEWLFITDTIDAVYRPANWEPTALADDLAENLDTGSISEAPNQLSVSESSFLTPVLSSDDVSPMMTKDELVSKVLRPFFGHLSIASYEATYKMAGVEMNIQRDALLKDLLDQKTLL